MVLVLPALFAEDVRKLEAFLAKAEQNQLELGTAVQAHFESVVFHEARESISEFVDVTYIMHRDAEMLREWKKKHRVRAGRRIQRARKFHNDVRIPRGTKK